jgi:hypothetical protein
MSRRLAGRAGKAAGARGMLQPTDFVDYEHAGQGQPIYTHAVLRLRLSLSAPILLRSGKN